MRKFAILLVLVTAAARPAQALPNGVTAELQIDQEQYMPDEDMQVKVRIINRSGQPVFLGADKQWITFNVIGEHEYIVPKLGEMDVKKPVTLLSGQEVTQEFHPTPYFNFRRPGRYRIWATLNVPQWKQEVASKAVSFTIAEGIALPDFENLAVGVPPPPGVTNAPPEMRRYSLLRVTYLDHMKLYFRLSDVTGHTLRVLPLARMVDFGHPEGQIDRASNFHVLFQTGAHTFTYIVLNPNGAPLARQFHEYTQTRPTLRVADDGQVFVGGGRRVLTLDDIPPPAPETVKRQ